MTKRQIQENLLEKVKDYLGITIDDEGVDRNLSIKIEAIRGYLIAGGATHLKDSKNISDKTIACLATGVNDLLNEKAGETKFSLAFTTLAMQICAGGD